MPACCVTELEQEARDLVKRRSGVWTANGGVAGAWMRWRRIGLKADLFGFLSAYLP